MWKIESRNRQAVCRGGLHVKFALLTASGGLERQMKVKIMIGFVVVLLAMAFAVTVVADGPDPLCRPKGCSVPR